jgi:uncharacterized membrane protein YhaH (DUF805 family)
MHWRILDEPLVKENMSNPYAPPDAGMPGQATSNRAERPKVFSTKGRIGRLRFMAYSWLVTIVVAVPLFFLIGILSGSHMPPGIADSAGDALSYYLAYAVTGVMAKRRFNDVNLSGWLALLILMPVVNVFVWLYLMFKSGTPGPNAYGPMPAPNSKTIVILALFIPLIFIIGILAAVGIPAYKDYNDRPKSDAMRVSVDTGLARRG